MWQADEDCLREAFLSGSLVFYQNCPGLVQVTGFGVVDNEPVAFLEDGGYAAVLACSREDFRVMLDITKWPPLP